jgi:NAD-dependent dihydropyrimidine dehydrogenase PreA subunit
LISLLTPLFKEETVYLVNIDVEKCDGCEECVNLCPSEVFEIQDGKSVAVNADECVFCLTCVEGCPNSAITVEEM